MSGFIRGGGKGVKKQARLGTPLSPSVRVMTSAAPPPGSLSGRVHKGRTLLVNAW